ncbi:hypothetical protein [Texcoconibacillus texcoconensis]|uniref:NERD domain-containing protein n=1 Tax=Texcoconibacillus texcoconensis TaxID=1095777 RepID=A0A840QN66_9BACI|nr:hypothetical protein [Texcoconibacillus texcoconensis]MBB5172798.1 hypothetical protein [Texcoconibacillus texcoconensis]
MAHLVKLEDYVSRYELDMYRYPSQLVRLKKERWKRMQAEWGHHDNQLNESIEDAYEVTAEGETKPLWKSLSRIKSWLPFQRGNGKKIDEVNVKSEKPSSYRSSEQALKQAFLDEIFHFQISWASSTITEKSRVKKAYYHDPWLSRFVKECPDNMFLFYYPIFQSNKAPIELDILLVTPTDIQMIVPLPGDDQTIYRYESERYWVKEVGEDRQRILNPMIRLKRMRTVISPILQEIGSDIRLKGVFLAQDSFIDRVDVHPTVRHIDKRSLYQWRQSLIRHGSPVKHNQLKAVEHLLFHCMTTTDKSENSDDEDF